VATGLRAVLFDLDDTLYPEIDFARSGFAAVAAALEARFAVPAAAAGAALAAALAAHGRGQTIDRALDALGIAAAPALIGELVEVYRRHTPRLALHPDAARALDRLRRRGLALGVVTDGDPGVQRAKAAALDLARWIDHLRCTWDDGAERQKPHPQAFTPALAALRVAAGEAAYVGDNPAKDFVGARGLGLHTVRLRRGPHRDAIAAASHAAAVDIGSLDELDAALGLARPAPGGAGSWR
jgi:putative hydrolase of the HAD superfamily